MIALLKILAVIVVLLALLRFKADLGLSLLVSSGLTAVLFGMSLKAFATQAVGSLGSRETLELVGIVVLVLYLGEFLQRGGHFRRMVGGLANLVRDGRLILAIPSAFIGLLPMTAGAMMGAPIVEEAGRPWNLSPAWKTFYNYWFRHIWEYSWPLYLNLIIAAAVLRVPIARLSLWQFPFTVLAAVTGWVVLTRRVPFRPKEGGNGRSWRDGAAIVLGLWPILLTIVLVFAARMNMLLALAISAVLTQVTSRMGWKERWSLAKAGVPTRIVLLTFFLMVFKRILETSGALAAVSATVRPEGASGYLLLFAAPFFVGLLTGVNQAFPAIAFPLLVPIIGAGHPDPALAVFAYVSGFVGILLSPAHLCLALTADYFKAEMRDVYRILVPKVAVIFAGGLIVLIAARLFF